MSEAKHTPGPWMPFHKPATDFMPEVFEIHYSNDGECVAEIVHKSADAKLIAAAPNMLEALEYAEKELTGIYNLCKEYREEIGVTVEQFRRLDTIRETIAKAKDK